MTLKSAAILALIGTLLLAIVVTFDFVKLLAGVIGGFVPAMALLRSLVYVFASVCVTVFFWIFSRRQS